jgi:crossover junction endodeoxyribonuclease RuvC
MLVVGIDPGTATTGYGFVRETEQGDLEAIDYGVIQTPAGWPAEQRLLLLYQELKRLLLLHHPTSGAVEKLFFQRNVTTAIAVGQGRGVVLLAMAESNLTVAEYTPMEVKQAITGYGGAEKKQIQMMAKALLNLADIPKPDDAADALAIAICHIHTNHYRELVQRS